MKKETPKIRKLSLNKEVILNLNEQQARHIAGGGYGSPTTNKSDTVGCEACTSSTGCNNLSTAD